MEITRLIKLRPHHLLCMLTYTGRGYTSAFVENFDRVVRALGKGEHLMLVGGPDDVCEPLAIDDRHCERQSVVERDAAALHIAGKLLGKPLRVGDQFALDREKLGVLRNGYLAAREAPCSGCEWFSFCGSVAAEGFRQTELAPDGNGEC